MKMSHAVGGGVLALTLTLLGPVLVISRSNTAPAITFKDCHLEGVPGRSVCATFDVSEDRERGRRTIGLSIAVLKATGASPKPDPIVPLQGGPGQAAVPQADFYARTLAPLREERDIVLIDVRGTGRSNPLGCDIADAGSVSSSDLLSPAAITACRTALESRADLRLYTTANIARDLDDVRRAMSIDRWNLYGTSYGTRLAQIPSQVRSTRPDRHTQRDRATFSRDFPSLRTRRADGARGLDRRRDARAAVPGAGRAAREA